MDELSERARTCLLCLHVGNDLAQRLHRPWLDRVHVILARTVMFFVLLLLFVVVVVGVVGGVVVDDLIASMLLWHIR
jgi:hypothetical protein